MTQKHFLVYLCGLIFLIKFRSTQTIASKFGAHSCDALQNFLNRCPEKTRSLYDSHQQQVVEATASAKRLLLMLDDTACPREGQKIQGLGFHHSAQGVIRGLCAVSALIKAGAQRFAWALRGYRTQKSCLKQEFKSKVQLALEILAEAKQAFHQKLTVLFDSWYTCAPILNSIQQAGWTFLGAIKKNRILFMGSKKTVVSALAKGPRAYQKIQHKKRTFKVAKKQVLLPKVGEVLLFISKFKGTTRFFITNDLSMTESQMIQLYAQRFDIELFHKEIKQSLGFKELFMRSWQGVQTHWTLIAIAYNLLVQLSSKAQSLSFRQKLDRFKLLFSPDQITRLAQLYQPA